MSLDFWNNPLVVSAFRVRYRRGPWSATAPYLMLLVIGGFLLHYYQDRTGGYWARNYFLGIAGLQFVVSGLRAVSATSASLKAEVVNRTLDFQRIAALSPRQILLGKLLGEPAQAYLLAVATIPLSMWCWLWGGVTLEGLVITYVQLATTTLLFGALGLLTRLDPAGTSSKGSPRGPEWVVFFIVILLFVFVPPVLMATRMAALNVPWSAALLGLATPLPAYYGLIEGNPWKYGLTFFGPEIPFALVTPLAQLFLAGLCFRTMVRQLNNPLNPAVGKPLGYLLMLVIDVLAAGVLCDFGPLGLPLGSRGTAFMLLHLGAGLGLMVLLTPWRETLESWVWRFRGRAHYWRDLWLGDRSENGLALLTFWLMGVVCLVSLIVLPYYWRHGPEAVREASQTLLFATLTSGLLLLSFGTHNQWWVFLAGRTGGGMILAFIILIAALPHLAGYYFELPWLSMLSPSFCYARWLANEPVAAPVTLWMLYGLILVQSWVSLHRRLRVLERKVDRKLQAMGVGVA